MTHYDMLGVAPDATQDELRAAFRRRARVLHPDTPSGDRNAMQQLLAAWEELRTPERRHAYDAGLERLRDDEAFDRVQPTDEWGTEVDEGPPAPVDEWGEEIHDGSHEVVDDQHYTASPPTGLSRPSKWRLVPLVLLLLYSSLPIVLYSISPIVALVRQTAVSGETVRETVGSAVVNSCLYAIPWILAYRVAKRRVRTGRVNKGYVAWGLTVGACAALLLVFGQPAAFAVVSTWLVLYVVTVELRKQQVWRT